MSQVISELIVTADMFARGEKSPGYYGYLGTEFGALLKARNEEPHRMLLGRKTYEMLNSLPEDARDDGWRKITSQPGFLFSHSLERSDWPAVEVVKGDLVDRVNALKQDNGAELRVLGSLSIARQLASAGLLDGIRLYVCPLVLPQSGREPVFSDWPEIAFKLQGCQVLDNQVLVLDYALNGKPPLTS